MLTIKDWNNIENALRCHLQALRDVRAESGDDDPEGDLQNEIFHVENTLNRVVTAGLRP